MKFAIIAHENRDLHLFEGFNKDVVLENSVDSMNIKNIGVGEYVFYHVEHTDNPFGGTKFFLVYRNRQKKVTFYELEVAGDKFIFKRAYTKEHAVRSFSLKLESNFQWVLLTHSVVGMGLVITNVDINDLYNIALECQENEAFKQWVEYSV